MRIRKSYSKSFKIKTLELCHQRGSYSQVAKELNLRVEMLYKWESSFKKGNLAIEENPERNKLEVENLRLRKALKDAELERDILKKAVSIFTKSDR
jgi:transposase